VVCLKSSRNSARPCQRPTPPRCFSFLGLRPARLGRRPLAIGEELLFFRHMWPLRWRVLVFMARPNSVNHSVAGRGRGNIMGIRRIQFNTEPVSDRRAAPI
jgi:hypothetical protein